MTNRLSLLVLTLLAGFSQGQSVKRAPVAAAAEPVVATAAPVDAKGEKPKAPAKKKKKKKRNPVAAALCKAVNTTRAAFKPKPDLKAAAAKVMTVQGTLAADFASGHAKSLARKSTDVLQRQLDTELAKEKPNTILVNRLKLALAYKELQAERDKLALAKKELKTELDKKDKACPAKIKALELQIKALEAQIKALEAAVGVLVIQVRRDAIQQLRDQKDKDAKAGGSKAADRARECKAGDYGLNGMGFVGDVNGYNGKWSFKHAADKAVKNHKAATRAAKKASARAAAAAA